MMKMMATLNLISYLMKGAAMEAKVVGLKMQMQMQEDLNLILCDALQQAEEKNFIKRKTIKSYY